jgi:hypothetical protein
MVYAIAATPRLQKGATHLYRFEPPVVAQQIVRRFSSLSARVVGVKNASGTMHARRHRGLIFDK